MPDGASPGRGQRLKTGATGEVGTDNASFLVMFSQKFNMLHLPALSFFSRRLYRDVGHRWQGTNLRYLCLLLAICCIPAAMALRTQLLHTLESGERNLLNQLPDIRISRGRALVDQKKPCHIRRTDGSPVAIVDTTGSMNFIADPGVHILLTEKQLVYRWAGNRFGTINLSGIAKLRINQHVAGKWIQAAKYAVAPLAYGLSLLLAYALALALVLLVAPIGVVFSIAMHTTLKFSGIWRISVAAATPATILSAVLTALGYPVSGVLLLLPFTLAYLSIGVAACRQPAAAAEKFNLMDCLDEGELLGHAHRRAA